MLIKFKRPDPRAGTIVRMDSSRGQDLVNSGAADEVKEDGSAVEGRPMPNPISAAGTLSSASPAAPASQRTTAKPSGRGGRRGKGAA